MAEFPVRANTNQAEREIDQLIGVLRKLKQEGKLTEQEFNDLSASAKKFGTEGSKGINAINKEMNNLSTVGKQAIGVLGAVFAVDQIKQFVGQVVQVTAEFQKFEAVLTNTLGSRSAAQAAMRQIQEFAAKTPFSVQELTASFVKLANQGFKPTADEMRRLGDVAASTGKQFDMLTEAIIDAQTGEFERLKEFGIRASKEGENVTFTFKGVQTQVEFTSEAIREYILSLGDAAGVSGSMAAISETLGGQISNLGDSWDTFLRTIGDGNSGVLSGAVALMKELLDLATDFVKTEAQIEKDEALLNQLIGKESFIEFAKAYKDVNKALDDFTEQQRNSIITGRLVTAEEAKRNEALRQQLQGARDYYYELEKIADQEGYKQFQRDAAANAEAERLAQEKLTKELKRQNDERAKAFERSFQFNPPAPTPTGPLNLPKDPFTKDPTIDQVSDPYIDDRAAERVKNEIELDRQREESLANLVDYSTMAFNEILRSRTIAVQQEMALLENQYRYELSLAGNNADARNAIQQRYDEQRRALMNRQAQVDQQNAIFAILVNQGPGIAKAIASAPPPLNFALGAAVAAYFALMLNNQRRIQPPRFKDGVFGLEGPGTETSDSILAMLSRNESVVPARKSRRFASVLKPMIEDDNFSMIDLKRIVDRSLPDFRLPVVMGMPGTDSKEVAEELRKTREAIVNKPETRIVVDNNGFAVYKGKAESWTRYTAKRYPVFE